MSTRQNTRLGWLRISSSNYTRTHKAVNVEKLAFTAFFFEKLERGSR